MATSVFKEYFKGYEILGELGRGNARVLKAKSLSTGKLAAIKHFAFNTDADTLRRFQRESEIMKAIQHHNIVKIIEVHLDAELPYIVMELIEGGDLRSLLKKQQALDLPTVITLAYHMIAALDAIHTRSIVHRDIKPENIMYRRTENGDIHFLLTDFGIARLREQADAVTVTGASMLTYDYAAPEQFNQSKTVGAAADYYALGVVIFECLTGHVPFEYEQDDLLMHINRVISAPLPVPVMPARKDRPAGWEAHEMMPSPSLLQLLEGLLRKQASLRIADPGSVQYLLQKAALEEPQILADAFPASGRKTIKNNFRRQTTAPKQQRRAGYSLALLLVSIAVLYSWTNLAGFKRKRPAVVPAVTGTQVKPANPILPTATQVVHTRHTPEITGDMVNSSSSTNPGIALVNGMYYNDFDQQDSVWDTGKDENSEFILLDGKYTMRGLNDSLNYSSSIKLNMDPAKDFTVAATATHDGEAAGDPYGIIFCGDQASDAFFVFYITSNGYYSIGESIKDDWHVLAEWTPSDNLRQDGALNILSVEKRGAMLRFFINDKLETVLPFKGPYGNYFGLRVDGNQTIAFDQFIVKGSSPINNAQ